MSNLAFNARHGLTVGTTPTQIVSPTGVITGTSIAATPISGSSGGFTTLTASGAATLTANTSSTNSSTGTLVVTGGVGVSENLNIGGNAVITGNLTVNGTTTSINATTLDVADINVTLAKNNTTDAGANGGGLTLLGTTNKTIIWDNTNANWTSSEHWNIASGKSFKINNVSVLTATTLGSSVVTSSLTSVGTIGTGTWNGNLIGAAYGGTGFNSSSSTGIAYISSGSWSAKSTTGSGNVVLDNTPTLITPVLGVATATSINKVTITAPATSATLTIANGKTLTINNSIIFSGTDSTTITLPATSATMARTDAAQSFTGLQSFAASGIALLGSSTGKSTFTSANSSATNYTLTFPAETDTVAVLATAQTLTNKTIALGSNVVSGTLAQFNSACTDADFVSTTGSGASGTWGINVTGSAGSAGSANTATTASYLAGGAGGSIPYQASAGNTAMIANGSASQILFCNGGTSAPSWGNQASIVAGSAATAANATTANNIAGGGGGQLLYQSGAGTTSMLAAGLNSQVLFCGGGASAPIWGNQASITAGSVPWSGVTGKPSAAWQTVGTTNLTLALGAWVATPFAWAPTDGSAYLVTVSWSYTGASEFSYFTGADIIPGSSGMTNALAVSIYRETIGAGSYGERVFLRKKVPGTGQIDICYSGRAGYANTYTAPTATVTIYRIGVPG